MPKEIMIVNESHNSVDITATHEMKTTGKILDASGNPIGPSNPLSTSIDEDIVMIIDIHQMILEGKAFYVYDAATKNNHQSILFYVTTPSNKDVHMTFCFETSEAAEFTIMEKFAGHSGGTTKTIFNRKRDSTNTSGCTVKQNGFAMMGMNTITILKRIFGAPGKIGGADTGSSEIILKRSTIYSFRLKSTRPGNKMNLELDWYEVD